MVGFSRLRTTEGAVQAKRAYKAMTKIEEADAKVHKEHRKYEKGVATNELKKKRADVGLAKHLHGLRPGYARLGVGLENAETNANTMTRAKRLIEIASHPQPGDTVFRYGAGRHLFSHA